MYDIVRVVESALGTSLTTDAAARLRAVDASMHGGQVIYHPAPRNQTKTLIIEAGTTAPALDVARRLGVSVRYVRRIRQLVKGGA